MTAQKSPSMAALDDNETTAETSKTATKKAPAKKAPAKKAPAKKAPAKKAAATTAAVEEDVILSTAKTIEQMSVEELLECAPKSHTKIQEEQFFLGGLITKIHEDEAWKEAGAESFDTYIEQVIGMGKRKARYLKDIYTDLVNSGVKWAQVESLGWTKVAEISHLLTPKTVKKWVATAQDMTVIQLKEYLKTMSSSGGDTKTKVVSDITTMTFKVHPDQKELITSTLDTIKKKSETEFDTVALQYMCEQWAEAANGSKVEASDGPVLPTTEQEWVELYKSEGAMAVLSIFEKAFPSVTLTVEGDLG
jgi:hypothetical protein